MMRAKTDIEHTPSGRECIVITEIPYMINKAEMIKKIADMINEKKIDGISYINDESDRNGLRIIIIQARRRCERGAEHAVQRTRRCKTSFAVNNIALVNGRPQMLPMRDLIKYFIEHRHDVVVRRTRFDKRKAEERLHIVQGLLIAQDNIDEIVRIIRASQTPDAAKQTLIERFELSDIQASAIIENAPARPNGTRKGQAARRARRTGEADRPPDGGAGERRHADADHQDELLEIKEKYGDERRSEIPSTLRRSSIPEDFYADDDMVITISHMGYIKRTPLAEYRTQNRGGVGAKKGSATRDEDFIEHIYVASMHNTMLFFTEKGRCFWLKGLRDSRRARVRRRAAPSRMSSSDRAGRQGPRLHQRQEPGRCGVREQQLHHHVYQGRYDQEDEARSLLAPAPERRERHRHPRGRPADRGQAHQRQRRGDDRGPGGQRPSRFNESTVRPIGRVGAGVRGISIEENDEVVGMICVEPDSTQDVLVLSENGYGKRTDLDEYRITNRGGKGVKTINVTEKTGKLISIQAVTDDNDLMIINRSGLTIRTAVSQIRLAGRATQGVRIINLREGRRHCR